MSLTIAVTGHRSHRLGGYGKPAVKLVDEFARQAIRREELKTYEDLEVITGMALGWDASVARVCAELGIAFIAAVPFIGQENNWPLDDRQEYHRLIVAAKRVVYVSPPGFTVAKMHKRNKWMVDNSTRLIALWSGGEGGTAGCVRYAQKVGRPVDNLWQEWKGYVSTVTTSRNIDFPVEA